MLDDTGYDDTGYTEPENVNTRIWRPSLPVIRLASAIQVCCSSPNPRTGPPNLEGLLLRGDVIESVIRTAEYHELVIAQSRWRCFDPMELADLPDPSCRPPPGGAGVPDHPRGIPARHLQRRRADRVGAPTSF